MSLEDWELSSRRLNINFNPGRYPVFISLLNLEPFTNKPKCLEIACVMLRLNSHCVLRWELAQCVDKSIFTYGIDYGKRSFMDVDAARYLCTSIWRKQDIIGLYDIDLYNIEPLDKEKETKKNKELEKNIIHQMQENRIRDGIAWANVQIREDTEANIITFDSGCGNDCCTSYIGYDLRGNPVSIVTDLDVANRYLMSDENWV